MAKRYPLHVRGDKKKEEAYDALLDGVPEHLYEFLTRWMKAALWDEFNRVPRGDRLLELQHILRATFDWSSGSDSALCSLQRLAVQKPDDFLSAIDYALQHWPVEELASELNAALEDAGSIWKAHWDGERYQLTRRMDESVQEALNRTIDKSERAGEHLRKALVAVYGQKPDASAGYRESVRAVEVASIAVISPNDKRATLGTVIAALKADVNGAKKIKLTLGKDTKVEPGDVLRAMNELLWTNQLDRHGTTDESVPLSVSLPQAEAAFHLACTLVHWFTTGRVTKT
jgi:hypothetical protein